MQIGNPERCAGAIMDVVKGEGLAKGKGVPTVVALGSNMYEQVKEYCEATLRRVDECREVLESTDFS
ncbi:hypothetical protein BDV98DRAFT_566175 [Pterulicium gracile]|uniref:Uncharacterized protein n=1 Tax=Pterulicium gracile TaxID=1884261 RepID=A0A5C3QP95_9AGAR|nr:hypothetical protein BDV98DRAFT_566175 [Pterula gracilis]